MAALLVVAGLAIGLTAKSADAATFDLGVLPTGQALILGNSNVKKGNFTDLFTFSFAKTDVQGAVNLVSVDLTSVKKIASLKYSLLLGNTVLFGPQTVASDLNFNGLMAVTQYTLKVVGKATGSQGGAYGGALTTIGVVPVPAALPLAASALAGLGGLGWLKRRRTQPEATAAV